MSENPFADDQPPSAFLDLLHEEDDDEEFSDDDDKDFLTFEEDWALEDLSAPLKEEIEFALVEMSRPLSAPLKEEIEFPFVEMSRPLSAPLKEKIEFPLVEMSRPLSAPLKEEIVSALEDVPVNLSSKYGEDGVSSLKFEARSQASGSSVSSQPSTPRLLSGAVSPLTTPSARRALSPGPPLASRSSASSPIPDEPVIIVGRGRARGGRRRGTGRSRGAGRARGGGRVGTATHRSDTWKPGDAIHEIYISDGDVPAALRAHVQAIVAARELRAERYRRTRREAEEEEFFDAEDWEGDKALFAGEEEATQFEWRPMDSFEGRREPFLVEKTGPTNVSTTAFEAFSQYWDEGILGHIVTETNRYAVTKKWADWYDTNIHEIRVLFSFWIMLGIVRMPSIKSCFSSNPLLFTHCFRLMFSRQRYYRLCSCLNFNDNTLRTPESSPLFPLEPIIDHLNSKFQSAYVPRQQVCIDESLTLWKGNLSFRQYIKTKAAKFGIKTFELCESATGYLWSFFVYTGKNTTYDPSLPPSLLKSTATVLSLIRPLLNRGYTLFMDNWFNSPLLTRFLKRNKTDVVGSLRPNRQHLPPLVTECELQTGQMVARHSGDMTVMAYYDKKKVTLISSYHNTETAQTPSKPFRRALWKPKLVLDYNANMGGVDLKDSMLEAYLLERKRCSKWSMKLFKRLLNVSILNAKICLSASSATHLEHVVFRLELVEQILKVDLGKVPKSPKAQKDPIFNLPSNVSEWHFPSTIAKKKADGRTARRHCAICKRQGPYECRLCNVGLCIDQCFKSFHVKAMK